MTSRQDPRQRVTEATARSPSGRGAVKAAAGRKAVGDYPFGYAGKGHERDAWPIETEQKGVVRIVELRRAGRSCCEMARRAGQRGTSPAGPLPGRLQPCATARFGRSTTDRAPGSAVARSPKRGAGTSSPVSKTPVAAGLRLAPDAAVSDAESPFPPCEVS